MAKKKTARRQKYFTPAEANAALPLVRNIVRDITELARDLSERWERLSRLQASREGSLGAAYQEEIREMAECVERDQERMKDYVEELQKLGVELKDYQTGLVDFPCRLADREVYLCWKYGEPEIGFWHEIDSGFAGRKTIDALGGSQRLAPQR